MSAYLASTIEKLPSKKQREKRSQPVAWHADGDMQVARNECFPEDLHKMMS